ncbi:hypothetical protein LTR16_003919 [Cryomyces antarcticus]|uniref:PepSY domain-containing protein n=1 Tax=Cryomyces antarcticus TaxID=329879 RepID=A0ABR0LXV1_9PEZI|nr:hypothetical protein LTR16_003919 [Cryomyces antarcticus]
MASDDDYASFLDKANQDTGASSARAAPKGSDSGFAATQAVTAAVPTALQSVNVDYVSETDEPFEGVSLAWSGQEMPSEHDFASLIATDPSSVSTLSEKDFDPRHQYDEAIDAVKKVGNGKVRVFRVEHGQARAEYWVVSLDAESGRVVGLRARSVES